MVKKTLREKRPVCASASEPQRACRGHGDRAIERLRIMSAHHASVRVHLKSRLARRCARSGCRRRQGPTTATETVLPMAILLAPWRSTIANSLLLM